MPDEPAQRRGRRERSLPLQALEGIGVVTLMALGVVAFGIAAAVVMAWLF